MATDDGADRELGGAFGSTELDVAGELTATTAAEFEDSDLSFPLFGRIAVAGSSRPEGVTCTSGVGARACRSTMGYGEWYLRGVRHWPKIELKTRCTAFKSTHHGVMTQVANLTDPKLRGLPK